MARPKKVDEILDGDITSVVGEIDEKVEALLEKLENISNADECREVIATAARYRLTKRISGPEEKTFREAALGALKAIEVSVRTGAGSQLTAAGEALVKMAENEEVTRERQRKTARKNLERGRRHRGSSAVGDAGPGDDGAPAEAAGDS